MANSYLKIVFSQKSDEMLDENMQLSKRNRINNPWITSGIIASISRKDFLHDNWLKTTKKLKNKEGDPLLYLEYKEFRRIENTKRYN